MLIKHLVLENFRNYEYLNLHLPKGILVFVGDNGKGKTSLLEAVGYLTTLESIRGAPNESIPRTGATGDPSNLGQTTKPGESMSAIARGEFANSQGSKFTLAVEIPKKGRIKARLNQKQAPSRARLKATYPITPFLPTSLDLISGPAARRRELFDRAVLLMGSAAVTTFEKLNNVLRQRNALLRSLGSTSLNRLAKSDSQLLDVYDLELAAHGAEWTRLRSQCAPLLESQIKQIYKSITGENSEVQLLYNPSWLTNPQNFSEPELGLESVPESELESLLHRALQGVREKDLFRQQTTIGPHKDDLEVRLQQMPARWTASRGEQRSLAVAWIFGIHYLISQNGESPILLLDDVLSELDDKRVNALLQNLPTEQVFITTTDADAIQNNTLQDQIFEVQNDVNGQAKVAEYNKDK